MNKISEQDYELIQRYYNYELDDSERDAVLERIKTDAAFKHHHHKFSLFEEELDKPEDTNKAAVVQNWKELLAKKKTQNQAKLLVVNNNRFIKYAIGIAASMILAFVVWGAWEMNKSSAINYAMAEHKNANTEKLLLANRGETNNLLNAAETYNNGAYLEAIELFKQVSIESNNYEEIALWEGRAYMQLEDWDKAINKFKEIDNSSKYIAYRDQSLWFLALSYILNDEPEKAKIKLQELIKENPNHEKAKTLLKKLE